MAGIDNLTSLHKHEEELRAQSVAEIQAKADLSDHWTRIATAMNAMYALTIRGPANMAQVGPFVDKNKLAMWLYELALRVSHAAVILVSNPEGDDRPLLATRQQYLAVVNKWYATYRNMTLQDGGSVHFNV